MSEAPVLEVLNVWKSFGGVEANHAVNLHLRSGEVRALIGPNGAGKTTLLNVVSGIYRPDRGEVRLAGRRLLGLRLDRVTALGLVRTFQVPRLFGNMTVIENLMVPASVPGDGRSRMEATRVADGLLDRLGLVKMRGELAKTLSGGQLALVQLAAGFMVRDLRCYLLDEAFVGMFPLMRRIAFELIEEYRRTSGVAYLVVTHEMATVRTLCENVTVMAEGQIVAEGTFDEVLANRRVLEAYLGRSTAG